jgi:hypothetical protein
MSFSQCRRDAEEETKGNAPTHLQIRRPLPPQIWQCNHLILPSQLQPITEVLCTPRSLVVDHDAVLTLRDKVAGEEVVAVS